jgi:hypothetical protein
MPESDDSPATSRMFLLGIVVWYNLVIWAAERAYAAMTRGASEKKTKNKTKRRDLLGLFQSALNAYIVYRL